ncbi:MAG TPA: cellulase family glycosylhydrolase [Gemmataceae bacterium]|nr:cellulase family glycosylhydrolase [Gemmataceae bacterium]
MRTSHQATVLLLAAAFPALAADKPIALHPDNPHYFLLRGKPAVLVTSGEHYGAVLNRDFDYVSYLNELQTRKFNLTRTFSGVYREVPGSFGIVDNTLAPAQGRYLCPWARSDTPGGGDGGNKFDLTKWDADYFARLKDFVAEAGKRGIVVELSLFCTIYDDKLWAVNPMNAANNVQGDGKVGRLDVYALKDKALTAAQETLVRKLAAELKDCDNLYYEVCNEPYFGGVTRQWTDRIIAVLRDAEKSFPAPHLIAQNIANGSQKIEKPNPHVSIFNFHYATPPDSVAVNARLRKVIGDDETGFRGTSDLPYRTEAWDFLLAGGGVYSNLDYSFSCKHPGGTAKVTTSPGGGGPRLRKQLQFLKEFMDGLDFVSMRPDNSVIKGGFITAPLTGNPPQAKATARALVAPGRSYAIYVRGGKHATLDVDVPAGKYRAEWINTKTGAVDKREDFQHNGGTKTLSSPPYQEDIALRIRG